MAIKFADPTIADAQKLKSQAEALIGRTLLELEEATGAIVGDIYFTRVDTRGLGDVTRAGNAIFDVEVVLVVPSEKGG